MSETAYLKCLCQQCGGAIEFPAHGVGSTIPCPHCGLNTILHDPAARPDLDEETTDTTRPRGRGRQIFLALALIVAAGIAAAWMARRNASSQPDDLSSGTARTNFSKRGKTASDVPRTNAAGVESKSVPVVPVKSPKSLDDLKVGVITLEKTKGSSLVHAIGVLKNASDHQRFGVSIELELTDARGNPAGTARDYRAVIEPRQEWRFRALVLDSKAVSAQVKTIREEE